MIPEPRLLCTSKQHSLVLPTTEWECVKECRLDFSERIYPFHQLFSEARLEQTVRRRQSKPSCCITQHMRLFCMILPHNNNNRHHTLHIFFSESERCQDILLQEDALKHLQMSAKYKSTSFASLTILGSLLHESEEFEDALNARLEASKLDPQIYVSISWQTYARLGRHGEALKSFHGPETLEENNIPYTAKSVHVERSCTFDLGTRTDWNCNSLRNLGKDADLIWRFG